jgi:mRNA interferase RelE/StbE
MIMNYTVDLKPRAIKDLKHLQKQDASRIADALEKLQSDLTGDVKKLTNFTPEYRLRVGQYRVLFEIENETRIIVYRVVHRREAYR